jgi:hypothetical protein
MKQFLFDKFNSFTSEVEIASLVRFTKNLPGTLHLDPGAVTMNGFPNWGSESNGYWTITRNEARFYENDGTIHCIGSQYNPAYCENYRLLTANLTGIRSLTLAETDQFEITNNDLISHSFGDTVYYAKFLSPAGELGKPITSMLLTGEIEANTELYKKITDYSCELYKGFKAAGILCPELYSPKVFFIDSLGVYVGIIKDFTVDLKESVDTVLNKGMAESTEYNYSEICNYGIEKWQALKI